MTGLQEYHSDSGARYCASSHSVGAAFVAIAVAATALVAVVSGRVPFCTNPLHTRDWLNPIDAVVIRRRDCSADGRHNVCHSSLREDWCVPRSCNFVHLSRRLRHVTPRFFSSELRIVAGLGLRVSSWSLLGFSMSPTVSLNRPIFLTRFLPLIYSPDTSHFPAIFCSGYRWGPSSEWCSQKSFKGVACGISSFLLFGVRSTRSSHFRCVCSEPGVGSDVHMSHCSLAYTCARVGTVCVGL